MTMDLDRLVDFVSAYIDLIPNCKSCPCYFSCDRSTDAIENNIPLPHSCCVDTILEHLRQE